MIYLWLCCMKYFARSQHHFVSSRPMSVRFPVPELYMIYLYNATASSLLSCDVILWMKHWYMTMRPFDDRWPTWSPLNIHDVWWIITRFLLCHTQKKKSSTHRISKVWDSWRSWLTTFYIKYSTTTTIAPENTLQRKCLLHRSCTP